MAHERAPGASWCRCHWRKSMVRADFLPYLTAVLGFGAALMVTAAGAHHQKREAAAVEAAMVVAPVTAAVAATGTAAKRSAPAAERAAQSSRAASFRWDRHLHATPPPGSYLRSYRMRATAYLPINTPMEGGRWTATRRDGRSAHGVAVDPKVIPLGTHVWIPGYGHAIADDTGGAIRGHRVDVRMQKRREMYEWGVRHVRVYVLKEPERKR
mgnify:CR=1 FL=1|jgi:Uncharacterized protein conserved in bacteria